MPTFNSETSVWSGRKENYPFSLDTYIGGELLRSLDEAPDNILEIHHEDDVRVTFAEIRLKSIRVAQNLIKVGISADDVVGIVCKNQVNLTPIVYGCAFIGAPVNPLDVSFTINDIRQMFGQTKPKIVICDNDVYDNVKQALDAIESNAEIYLFNERISGIKCLDDLLEPTGHEDEFVSPKFKQDASEKVLAILCSSGTTGSPKGVIIAHTNLLMFSKLMPTSKSMITTCFSSLYWLSGFHSTILAPFNKIETRIISKRGFSVELLIEMIEKHKITSWYTVPSCLTLFLQSKLLETSNFDSLLLIIAVGSLVSEQLRNTIKLKLPKKLFLTAYGLTESSVSFPTLHDKFDGLKVGKITPNYQVKVVDEAGNGLGIGETGEIYVKPMFKLLGYYNNPQATMDAVTSEGYLRTGDIGNVDSEGNVSVFDRNKDLLKFENFQINPSELENIIESMDDIEMVSVIGIPHEMSGDLPAAVIVLRNGSSTILNAQDVIDYVAARVSIKKQLHGGVYFVNELPMTASGKVQKRFVKAMANEMYEKLLKRS